MLTSYDDGDLHAAGYRLGVSDLVEARARQAQALGVDGLVCSPEEAASLRKIVGHQMNLVTPGIRPAGAATGDQKRIMTPARAIAAGADYLVVGRPVHGSRRSQGGGGCHRRGNRAGVGLTNERENANMAKGYWIARVDVHNVEGYKEYAAPTARSSRNTADVLSCAAASSTASKAKVAIAQCGDRIQGLRDRAGLLQFAGIPGEYQAAAAAFDRDLVIIEGYDGAQP